MGGQCALMTRALAGDGMVGACKVSLGPFDAPFGRVWQLRRKPPLIDQPAMSCAGATLRLTCASARTRLLLAFLVLGACAVDSHPAREDKFVASPRITSSSPHEGFDPHVHGTASIRPAALYALAQRFGTLEASLKQLGLRQSASRAQVLAALNIVQENHNEAFAIRKRWLAPILLKEGALKAWFEAIFSQLDQDAPQGSILLFSLNNLRKLAGVFTDEELDALLAKHYLLINFDRGERIGDARIAHLLEHDYVAGFDLLAPEHETHDGADIAASIARDFFRAYEGLVSQKRRPLVLMLHIGEGYMSRNERGSTPPQVSGRGNVVLYLSALLNQCLTVVGNRPIEELYVVIAHASRIDDLDTASRLIQALQVCGVRVRINVNPLSNLLSRAVLHVSEIDGLELARKLDEMYGRKQTAEMPPGKVPSPRVSLASRGLLVGTDNIGTLQQNQSVIDYLRSNQKHIAQELAEDYLNAARELP